MRARIIRPALRDIWRCLPDLVLFQAGFEILILTVLTPTVAWLVQGMINRSGDQAIGNLDIVAQVASPGGLLALSVAGALVAFLTFLRVAGIACMGHAAADGTRVSALEALNFVRIRVWAIARLSFLGIWTLIVLEAPPVLIGYGTYRWLLGEYDINFYLASGGSDVLIASGIGLALLVTGAGVFLLAYVVSVFGLMKVLLEDVRPWRAVRSAGALVLARIGAVARPLPSWIAGWLVATVLVQTAVSVSGGVTLSVVGASSRLIIPTLIAVLMSSYASTLALSVLLLWGGHFVLVRLYRHLLGLDTGTVRVQPSAVVLAEHPDPARAGRVLAISLLLILASVAISVVGLARWQPVEDQVHVTAHLGSSSSAPENTLAAIERAIQDRADFVEIDVRLTADSSVVLSHDADLMRTAGVPVSISASTPEELQAIDVGGLFDEEYQGERIPTLEQAVDLIRNRIRLAVEIKSTASDGLYLTERVVEILKEDRLRDAVVLSLRLQDLQHVRRLAPDMAVGYVTAASVGRLERLDVDHLAVASRLAGHVFIAEAHAAGKEVWVWTLDDPVMASRMIERGVDNVITNQPALVAEVLRERASMDPAERMLLRFHDMYMP
jgi:glycerophosphoryl diester phosphodiesterase